MSLRVFADHYVPKRKQAADIKTALRLARNL
jgi:hypothetical protein